MKNQRVVSFLGVLLASTALISLPACAQPISGGGSGGSSGGGTVTSLTFTGLLQATPNPITGAGAVSLPAPLAGIVYSNGSALGTEVIAGNLIESNGTLTGTGGAYTAGTGLTLSGSVFSLTNPVPVSLGGLGITTGISGGIIGFTATGLISSSGALTLNALVVGGGPGATPSTLGSLGTTTTLLHGNASGAPSFGAVGLTTDVSGVLTVPNGGSGAGTFTAHGVLLGEGTAAHGVTGVGTNAQMLLGQSAADPSWQTMSGDATIGATGVIAVAKVGGDANVAFTDTKQTFTAAQRGTVNALTFGSTITPSFDVANNFSVTLTGAATLANPSTTPVPGQAGQFTVTQDSTGGRTLAFGTLYKFPGGSAPTLSTGAGAVDILSYYVVSATQIAVSTGLNFQ